METIKKEEALEVLRTLCDAREELVVCMFSANVSIAKDGGGHWKGAPEEIGNTLSKVEDAISVMGKYYD